MLYKFKSQACAAVIMLENNGQQMLEIIGKEVAPQGIITVDQIPEAVAALEAAIVAHEAARQKLAEAGDSEEEPEGDSIMLRQRAAPFIDLLKRSAAAGKHVVWGV